MRIGQLRSWTWIGRGRSTAAALLALTAPVPAMAGAGPDLVVSRVGETSQTVAEPDYAAYGVVDGIAAFSAGTTSCNVGDEPAEWVWGDGGRHPVIALNLYRLQAGRFEQIGMSWLKHSFCAGNEFTCGTCQVTGCETLGVGCADTYWATLNGDWMALGPRSQVDPQAWGEPTHVGPPPPPVGPDIIRGRLQVAIADLGVSEARYFLEAQYVTHDEAPEDRHNNATWRQVAVGPQSLAHAGDLHVGEPAILAWPVHDPEASVVAVDVPGEGRFHLGWRVVDLGDGTWQYDYALHNLNSARAAASLEVPLPRGAAVVDASFRDVDAHSGEIWSSADWTFAREGDVAAWSTVPWAVDPLANALRWGTLYRFSLRTDQPPEPRPLTIGLFTPGKPDRLLVTALAPADACPADLDGSGAVDIRDLVMVVLAWGLPDPTADLTGDGLVDVEDLVAVITAWGPCPP